MKLLFITGTDTDVGKTVATLALGALLQEQGCDVRVMKPVQCSGDDAALLKRELQLDDPLDVINPFYAKDPLSPHLALERAGIKFDLDVVKECIEQLSSRKPLAYPGSNNSSISIFGSPIKAFGDDNISSPLSSIDFQQNDFVLLIEGAGGLFVPIYDKYCMIDLIDDLDAEAIVVSRLGLGAINHSLLTINALRDRGIVVRGIIFSDTVGGRKGIPEQTNPQVIEEQTGVPVLGIIPNLKKIDRQSVLKACHNFVDITKFISYHLLRTTYHSKRLSDQDKRFVWHPFTQMRDWEKDDPLVIHEGKGSYLIDDDGNEYIDGISSLWVTVHGHRKREIDQAIKDQINRISHSTMLGLTNTPAVELAKELVALTPKGLDKVFYSDNGSTSVEIAIKMAYQYWQNIGQIKKTQIVHLENSYHGDTLGSVSIGGIDLFHQVYRHMIFKTIKLDWPDGYRDQDFDGALARFEELLDKKSDSIAALVVEPLVQGAAGMFMWPKGVLKKLRQLTKKYGVFLICDEVATGFGRTGTMFACEQESVTPDFLCLSKGITGGYLPLAATLTSNKVYEGFKFPYKEMKTFFHGHTYTGNPLACAAALANIRLFKQEKTLQKMGSKIKHLAKRLESFYTLPSVGDIRQKGFMVGIELVADRDIKKPFDWQKKIGVQVCQKVREYGVILRPLGNVIVLMPPLSITKKELDIILNATYRAIDEVASDKVKLNG